MGPDRGKSDPVTNKVGLGSMDEDEELPPVDIECDAMEWGDGRVGLEVRIIGVPKESA